MRHDFLPRSEFLPRGTEQDLVEVDIIRLADGEGNRAGQCGIDPTGWSRFAYPDGDAADPSRLLTLR
jgi:hypothetical protein